MGIPLHTPQKIPLLHEPGTPRPTSFLWLFQLDDSKSLHRKWLEITKHPLKNGCLGYQELHGLLMHNSRHFAKKMLVHLFANVNFFAGMRQWAWIFFPRTYPMTLSPSCYKKIPKSGWLVSKLSTIRGLRIGSKCLQGPEIFGDLAFGRREGRWNPCDCSLWWRHGRHSVIWDQSSIWYVVPSWDLYYIYIYV